MTGGATLLGDDGKWDRFIFAGGGPSGILPTRFRWIKKFRDECLWRQDLDAAVARYIEQVTIPADDDFGVACQSTGQKLVIVGIFANGFLKVRGLDQFGGLNEQAKDFLILDTRHRDTFSQVDRRRSGTPQGFQAIVRAGAF